MGYGVVIPVFLDCFFGGGGVLLNLLLWYLFSFVGF